MDLHFDASIFKDSICLHKMYRKMIQGYRPTLNSIQIEFGSAVHRFREIYRARGYPAIGDAIGAAIDYLEKTPYVVPDKQKTYLTDLNYLKLVCMAYAHQYQNDNFQPIMEPIPMVELKFSVPYKKIGEHNIFLDGTIDELGMFKSSKLTSVLDCKTTSVWKVDEYLKGYYLSGQLAFYVYVIGLYAKYFPDSFLGKYGTQQIASQVDGIFLMGKDKWEFKRSDVFVFKPGTLLELERIIDETIDRLLVWVQKNELPLRYGLLNSACNTKFGRCDFFNVCAASDDRIREAILEQHFKIEPYDPSTFGVLKNVKIETENSGQS